MSILRAESSSYLTMNPSGKIETIIDSINEEYVFARCLLFLNKEDTSPIISEMGISVTRGNNENIGITCSHAINMAYENAVRRLSGILDFSSNKTDSNEQENVPNTTQFKDMTTVSELGNSTTSASVPLEQENKTDATTQNTKISESGSVVKLDLSTGGSNASSLAIVNPSAAAETYLEFTMELLGKPHECYGWSIKDLLEKRPDVIVSFYPRYNGRNEEAKTALKAAYPEALLRQEEMKKLEKTA